MFTLALDASTYSGSVAVIRGGNVLAAATPAMRGEREERLMPAVADVLARTGADLDGIDRVVCGAGPGSFTSLRIAASIAKGLCAGSGKPLFAVSSLLLIVAALPDPEPGRYLAVLDAMRGERFAALIDVSRSGGVPAYEVLASAGRFPAGEIPDLARKFGARVAGPGQELDAPPHASAVAMLEAWLADSRPVDLVSWEPDYGRAAEAQVRWEAEHGRPLQSR